MPATASIQIPNQKSRFIFPVLTGNEFIRYFNFIVLYIAQGIPEGMTFFGIPAWMAMHGKTPGEIGGFVAMVGLPWSCKIFIAPLMDRFTYLPMGRRRPWVLVGQLGLMVSFISMAFIPDPLNNMKLLLATGFAIGFFGAFQDIATDGMAIDVIPPHQQARANGFMWGAKIMGTSASLATGSWVLNKYGFSSAILTLSFAVCLIMIVPLIFRERAGEKFLPWTKGAASDETSHLQFDNWKNIFSSLLRVFTLRNSLIFALVGFVSLCGFNFMDTMLPVFTVQALGWTDQLYAKWYATASLTGGITGMIIGGILIDRFGKIKMLNIYLLSVILLSISMSVLKNYWHHAWFITGFMMAYGIVYVFTSIGIFATAMQCCWKKISATQFTLYMTIANLGRITGAKLIGPVKQVFSWQYSILFLALAAAISFLLLQFVQLNNHIQRVEEIDQADKTFSGNNLTSAHSKIN
ncbi:MAG: MFS transporter [Bacteroidetes bacterium]|nr:MFS transporter [Bacteroidota bacterium]